MMLVVRSYPHTCAPRARACAYIGARLRGNTYTRYGEYILTCKRMLEMRFTIMMVRRKSDLLNFRFKIKYLANFLNIMLYRKVLFSCDFRVLVGLLDHTLQPHLVVFPARCNRWGWGGKNRRQHERVITPTQNFSGFEK